MLSSSTKDDFLALPTELHIHIASFLPYPDALSLKHTSRYFYELVDTGIRLKVAWLVERNRLHLDCPKENCILKTDAAFCSREVRTFMERRRWHEECVDGRCIVVKGTTCEKSRKRGKAGMRRWVVGLRVALGDQCKGTDMTSLLLMVVGCSGWVVVLALGIWWCWIGGQELSTSLL